MIAVFRPVTTLRLYDAGDEPWIEQLLDVVETAVGQPWRRLLELIDAAPLRAPQPHIAAMLSALRRVIGGRAERGRIARKVRAIVLGHPALDRDARDSRLAAAATALGVECPEVESLLWADLANERPVVLPNGRPAARVLVGFANLDRIQRAMRRAHEIELRVWGDAHDLVRTAARCGLIASVSQARDGATVLDVTGPLTLFHDTMIYGRALAALVPLLADHDRFTLDIRSRFGDRERTVRVAPPLCLPPVPLPRTRRPSLAERLARQLADAGCTVEREPPAIASGDHLLFPDLVFARDGARRLVEIVGFSTDEYLAHKLARYDAAGVRDIVLCVDTKRGDRADRAGRAGPSGHIMPYEGRIDAAVLLAMLDVSP